MNVTLNSKTLGVIGALALALGVFLPLIRLPIVGSVNYFMNGKGDGTIMLFLAVIAILASLRESPKILGLSGFGALAMLVFTFVNFQIRLEQIKDTMDRELAGNPFRGIADVAVQGIQLEVGWFVLGLGVGIILFASYGMKQNMQKQLQHEIIDDFNGKSASLGTGEDSAISNQKMILKNRTVKHSIIFACVVTVAIAVVAYSAGGISVLSSDAPSKWSSLGSDKGHDFFYNPQSVQFVSSDIVRVWTKRIDTSKTEKSTNGKIVKYSLTHMQLMNNSTTAKKVCVIEIKQYFDDGSNSGGTTECQYRDVNSDAIMVNKLIQLVFSNR